MRFYDAFNFEKIENGCMEKLVAEHWHCSGSICHIKYPLNLPKIQTGIKIYFLMPWVSNVTILVFLIGSFHFWYSLSYSPQYIFWQKNWSHTCNSWAAKGLLKVTVHHSIFSNSYSFKLIMWCDSVHPWRATISP